MAISVEAIIQAAFSRGDLEDLPYKGERIPLDDDSGVHPEDRLAFRVLKNANMVPPEVSAMQEISALRDSIKDIKDPEERRRMAIKIAEKDSALRMKMERNRRR